MKIIILIALRGVKFPEGGAATPVAPPWIRPWNTYLHPVSYGSAILPDAQRRWSTVGQS